jgi:hypothetical protein
MKGDGTKKPSKKRSSIYFAHEVGHFVLREKGKRIRLGLPHTSESDIVNDWLLAHALSIGYKLPDGDGDNSE